MNSYVETTQPCAESVPTVLINGIRNCKSHLAVMGQSNLYSRWRRPGLERSPHLSVAVLTLYPTRTTVSMASESSLESLKLKHW